MKQNKFFILAAALAFVACSSDDNYTAKEKAQQAPQEVSFDTYVNRGTTRAGATGELTTDGTGSTTSLQTIGFGVFAYYTDAEFYDQTFTPNFMYNQHVTFNSSNRWTYTPVKYWPNEFGSNAQSDDVDQVSFFAYAPFVTVDLSTGKVKDNSTVTGDAATYSLDDGDLTKGIVGMTKNTATGDPMIKYISTFYTDQQVDLVWGTVPASTKWKEKETSTEKNLTAGKPWLDIQHPYTTSTTLTAAQKVTFNFQHALAALNVTVDLKVNKNTVNDFPTNRGTSKVYIRSVTFEGFDTMGALNLNNTEENKALWFNFECCCTELPGGAETTIKDGRKDAKEGLYAATNEYNAINPDFVQSTEWGSTDPAEKLGVTGTAANLFRLKTGTGSPASFVPAPDAPIYVIPNGDKMKVTIEYDVLTADANLAGTLNDGKTKGSVVKNVITRYITTTSEAGSVTPPTGTGDATDKPMVLENGKKYTINLHLGLNSVEFDATVTGWATGVTGGADLPHNN